MAETALVTGGAGFIGSHIVDALLADGYRVAVIDNLSTGRRENVNPEAAFYEVDIRDVEGVCRVFEAERPALVSHQAAQADVRASLDDPAGYAATNILGTLNVLQAAKAMGTRKFVFASTGGAIYGNPDELPATERCPARPLDPYGTSKLACEYYLYTYKHNFGLEYCVLRYANVYGPRQNGDGEAGVVAIFAKGMLEDRPLTIWGDGLQSRDFVYVGDVAAANLAAARYGSGIYNIGTGLPSDIQAIARGLARVTGYTKNINRGPARPGEVRHSYLDARKARREMGWEPQVTLADGLARTVTWFREGK
ncbi:MAG: NAD-dependent epimerase/dehydratase family protein [Nitrososphaerales archaeon]